MAASFFLAGNIQHLDMYVRRLAGCFVIQSGGRVPWLCKRA
ncbi:MAG TPA: hypothetical protein VH590_05440 [Ktedonobacterales bacterium]